MAIARARIVEDSFMSRDICNQVRFGMPINLIVRGQNIRIYRITLKHFKLTIYGCEPLSPTPGVEKVGIMVILLIYGIFTTRRDGPFFSGLDVHVHYTFAVIVLGAGFSSNGESASLGERLSGLGFMSFTA